jgi:subtilase family serine protease
MSFWRAVRSSLRDTNANRNHSRRLTTVRLPCESLEFRQLLSVSASGTLLDQIAAQPAVQVIPFVNNGPSGYSPQQIQNAYGVNQIKFANGIVGNGAGQTIAIVDAYNDPNIASDLAKFDAAYGLPAPPSFKVDNLGATTTDPGWALEESLDVEWAHALAPKANIILVEAPSASLNGLFNAVSAASKIPNVSVVSMSWGTQEFFGEWNYDSIFTTPAGHTPITYVASSGDNGAWYGPMYPSVSPNVVAVGGTTLTLSSNGAYGSESGWSGSTGGFSGTDNNFWFGEYAPSYQVAAQQAAGLSYGVRTTPDVSFNADPNSGVAVYDSVPYSGQSGWFELGGTSVAAPSWAGLVAITDQGLAAAHKSTLSSNQLLTQLYNLPSSDFHNITTGFNGYNATSGYNLVTGLGSPKANTVVAGLLSANGVSSASSGASNTVVASATSHAHARSTSGHGSAAVSTSSGAANSGTATTSFVAPTSLTGLVQFAPLSATGTTNVQTGNASGQVQSIAIAGSSATSATSLISSVTLGQGLQPQGSLIVVLGHTTDEAPGASIVDTVETGEEPAPALNPAAEPGAIPNAEPTPQPASPPQFMNPWVDPTLPYLDALINQWRDKGSNTEINEPLAPQADDGTKLEVDPRSASGVSIIVGTAMVLAGGHGLAKYRAGWRRRWLSQRFDSVR